MDGLELRKALSEAAGWKWRVDSYDMTGIPHIDEMNHHEDREYAWIPLDGLEGDSWAGTVRLSSDEPLSWNDVMAACEAAGFRDGHVLNIYRDYVHLRQVGDGLKLRGMGTGTGPEAVALALIAGHRERTRNESEGGTDGP